MLPTIVCALLILPAASQVCQCDTLTTTTATTTTTTTGCPAGSTALRPVDYLVTSDDAALCSTTTTTATTSTVTTSTVTTSTVTTSTVTTSTVTTTSVTTSTVTTSTVTTTTCTCTTTAVTTATTSTKTTSTLTTSTQTTSTKTTTTVTTTTVTTSTVTTSTVTTLSGCSGNRCRVCRTPTFSDTDTMANHIAGTLYFGPSQFNNAIDEAMVTEYRVIFADTCGNQVGDWFRTVAKSDTVYTCCEPTAYQYVFSDTKVPAGATQLAVLVTGSDGTSGGMWATAINDDRTVADDGHDHGGSSTTPKGVSGVRAGGLGVAVLAVATLAALA